MQYMLWMINLAQRSSESSEDFFYKMTEGINSIFTPIEWLIDFRCFSKEILGIDYHQAY